MMKNRPSSAQIQLMVRELSTLLRQAGGLAFQPEIQSTWQEIQQLASTWQQVHLQEEALSKLFTSVLTLFEQLRMLRLTTQIQALKVMSLIRWCEETIQNLRLTQLRTQAQERVQRYGKMNVDARREMQAQWREAARNRMQARWNY